MSDIPSPKISVRYVPHTEAPGRPVRIDYCSIAHEYVTRLDAIEINRDSTLGVRCKEATGLEPDWVEQGMSEAYSQLAAILTTLDAPAQEKVTEADFDLFPVKPTPGDFEVRKDADGGFTVLGGCKVSDPDDHRKPAEIPDLSMDLRAPFPDTFVDECIEEAVTHKVEVSKTKPRPTLLPVEALTGALRALTLGAEKHGDRTWREIPIEDFSRLYGDAFLRHVLAAWSGEGIDPEHGLAHLDHALANLLFLRARAVTVLR